MEQHYQHIQLLIVSGYIRHAIRSYTSTTNVSNSRFFGYRTKHRRAQQVLANQLKRHPDDEEIMAYMNVGRKEYRAFLEVLHRSAALSIEEDLISGLRDDRDEIDDALNEIQFESLMAHLSKREKKVLRLIYQEGYLHVDASKLLGTSRQNVTNACSAAYVKLRKLLEE